MSEQDCYDRATLDLKIRQSSSPPSNYLELWFEYWLDKCGDQIAKKLFTVVECVRNDRQLPSHMPRRRLIFVLHGIRDEGAWMEMVKAVLEDDDTKVQVLDYNDVGALEFIFGRGESNRLASTVSRIRHAITLLNNEKRELIAIGHSYGTYLLLKTLEANPDLQFKQLILCGSVIPKNFAFDRLRNCPEILNECGGKDIFPVLAEGFGFGRYGSAGVYGLRSPGIEDRYHDFGHSDYLERSFVETYWLPFIKQGKFVLSPYQAIRRPTPRAVRLLSRGYRLILFCLIILALPIVAYFLLLQYQVSPVKFWTTLACTTIPIVVLISLMVTGIREFLKH